MVTRFSTGPAENGKCHSCRPHASTTECHRNYFATCAQMATHVITITLLMPVTMDDLSAPNATVTGEEREREGCEEEEGRREGCVLLEMLYKLKFRTPACLGSYSCCNNLLGILLHHPSRTAATRARNKSRDVTMSSPRITKSRSMRRVEGRLDLHIQASCGNGWLRHRHSPQAAATRGCYRGWRCHATCGRWRHWGPVAPVR